MAFVTTDLEEREVGIPVGELRDCIPQCIDRVLGLGVKHVFGAKVDEPHCQMFENELRALVAINGIWPKACNKLVFNHHLNAKIK